MPGLTWLPLEVTFVPLRTVGFIEFRGLRVNLTHPEDRYRELGRSLIRDAFQMLPEDLVEVGPLAPP